MPAMVTLRASARATGDVDGPDRWAATDPN